MSSFDGCHPLIARPRLLVSQAWWLVLLGSKASLRPGPGRVRVDSVSAKGPRVIEFPSKTPGTSRCADICLPKPGCWVGNWRPTFSHHPGKGELTGPLGRPLSSCWPAPPQYEGPPVSRPLSCERWLWDTGLVVLSGRVSSFQKVPATCYSLRCGGDRKEAVILGLGW